MKTGDYLRLVTLESIVYFRIIEIEPTAYRTEQICIVTDGTIRLKYRHRVYSSIYKSEIGRNYCKVEAAEISQLKEKMTSKMLDDYQLLCSTFDRVFELLD